MGIYVRVSIVGACLTCLISHARIDNLIPYSIYVSDRMALFTASAPPRLSLSSEVLCRSWLGTYLEITYVPLNVCRLCCAWHCFAYVLGYYLTCRCGPCRMVGPVVDEVIDDHGEILKVVELCTDENPATVAKFNIRNIPTLMLFDDRKSVMTVVGAVPKSGLVSSIKKHMDL